ncbi:DNA helicase-2/ATP-dependent DNA helicase PcrA [Streptomyces thermodiastaticus]|uniref:DNA 3'-5' helicase n=1 Tax=Streptomyces thermodiastaticus TaxID=44061 RepID=A0ABU0K8X1_9ACTN|nr:DNA helicase-2/ATP-dependent DNA helicase PcrA [Streptomyces thermodiastaticus]UVT11683.1 ATP-dependent helicase [Streptomyces thermocarboxydus]WSB43437.1 ATP-dependent helicase [Streptomyces cellulosae]WTF22441.1 ATP-dependent helicase [Streptomyces cellulosae]
MPARITRPDQLKELLGIPFTPEQTACITAPPAPQVIVAGAGSGKTTVMAARVVWLVGTGQVAPEQVLGLTFTNKAAGELAERVRTALIKAGVTDPDPLPSPDHHPSTTAPGAGPSPSAPDNPPGEPVISTYHAFAGRLLTDHGLRIGLEPTSRLLADATRYQLAARVLREAPGLYPALTRSFPDLVGDLLTLDSELSEHLVRPEDLRAHDTELLRTLENAKLTNADLRKVPEAAAARRELAELVQRYRAAKRERDLLDFGDQIALSARLAGLPEVGRVLRDEFRVVLLDEYQDTSVAQRVLLAGLFGGGTGHPVTAVGDPCQAIYGWRGASVANLDDFPEHFPHADGRPATRQSLSENRRSGGRLLDLANGLAEPLRAMHAGVEALRPAPGAERDGIVRCALLRTHAEEIDWLADSIAHLVNTGKAPGEIAVLCRTATDFAEIQAALVARDVPVEVVGLSGLLHLPEIADLVAVCEVLQDPGANASLVRLLTGPRWRIGPRDLALLGRRARRLVSHARVDGDDDPDRRLAEALEGVDPAEVISLADALDTFLETPLEGGGDDDGLPFSPDARVRFARLAAELRDLRRSLSDPLMDVLHRVLAVTGLEVELSASPHALAARRRETLSNFLDVAASFAAGDNEATLLAFLGFLRTAAQYEKGLDNALPGGENTVKVLTAHKSKGLEWDVVAVPGLVTGAFPSDRGREKWTAQGKVLPHALRGDADTLPDVPSWDSRGLKAFHEAMKEHQHTEELRLGYVTFTRPRSLLLGSGHWWGPSQKKSRGPSEFLLALHDHCAAGYGEIEAWAEKPEEDEENPALRQAGDVQAWPLPLDDAALARRRAAAATVLAHLDRIAADPHDTAALHDPGAHDDPEWPPPPDDEEPYPEDFDDDPYADDWDALPTERPVVPHQATAPDESARPLPDLPAPAEPRPAEPRLTPEEARTVASWDRDLDALTGELLRARETVTEVRLPASLTASQLLRLADDPDAFARELARPMPRPPQPAARRGTRFHAWVEARFEELTLPMLDPDELPGADAEIADERDLEELKEAFERTEYAHRTPYRVEAPFQLSIAGRVVRGRIDAVYRHERAEDPEDPGDGDAVTYEIVDWKTGRSRTADPLQLAVYRLAWAEQQGVPLKSVTAAFLYVRTGEVVRPERLPGRAELERLLLDDPEDGTPNGPEDETPNGSGG